MPTPPPGSQPRVPVYLFVPNLIGYVRIALNVVALAFALTDYRTCLACYLVSALLDAADGYAARALGQSSMLGAVLDMVTDRTATASLCVVLAHLYPAYLVHFCSLIMLDIFSHWAHVYVSALLSRTTHKQSSNWIVRLYYHKPVLFCVCAGNELFYMFLYLLHFVEGPVVAEVSVPYLLPVPLPVPLVLGLLLGCAPVFAFKQFTNVIQMVIAFGALNRYEVEQRTKAN